MYVTCFPPTFSRDDNIDISACVFVFFFGFMNLWTIMDIYISMNYYGYLWIIMVIMIRDVMAIWVWHTHTYLLGSTSDGEWPCCHGPMALQTDIYDFWSPGLPAKSLVFARWMRCYWLFKCCLNIGFYCHYKKNAMLMHNPFTIMYPIFRQRAFSRR